MALSLAKRRFIRRMVGYATNPVRRRARTLLNREQTLSVRGLTLHLPPAHDLPFYVKRDPTYDAYAIDLIARLVQYSHRPLVIDVGANVGDTAIAALAADPRVHVHSVEGSATFTPYLERNLAPHQGRASYQIGFVGPVGDIRTTFGVTGTTGGFGGGTTVATVDDWVSPADLLAKAEGHDFVVWKSDIDGFDIHVLVDHFEVIAQRCDVIWFEFDPVRTLGERSDVPRLVERLAASGRPVLVYDNLGRLMIETRGPGVRDCLSGLTRWMSGQTSGHLTVPYLDVWVLPETQP